MCGAHVWSAFGYHPISNDPTIGWLTQSYNDRVKSSNGIYALARPDASGSLGVAQVRQHGDFPDFNPWCNNSFAMLKQRVKHNC